MKVITQFDPSQLSGRLNIGGVNEGQQLVLYNDSRFGMVLTFADRTQEIIPAAWGRDYVKTNIPIDVVEWTVFVTLQGDTYPVSVCYGVLYEPGEHIPSFNNSIQRGMQVTGGNLQTVSQVSVLQNDGNAANQQIIEAKVSGQTNSTITLTNDGLLLLNVLIGAGLVQVMKTQNAGSLLLLGASAKVVEILGNFTVDGSSSLDNGAITTDGSGKIIASKLQSNVVNDSAGNSWASITPGSVTRIQNATQVAIQVPGGSGVLSVVSTGINVSGDIGFSGTLSPGGDITFGGNILNNPLYSYSANQGMRIGENNTTTNGFAIGRNSGNSVNVIATFGSGIGFKKGGIAGTKLAEMQSNGNFIIGGNTYWTNQSTFNFNNSQPFDGFDYAEFIEVDQVYPDGTVVCPQQGKMRRCIHFNCPRACIISHVPAFCAGNPEYAEEIAQPIALCGRKLLSCRIGVHCGDFVYSSGDGMVECGNFPHDGEIMHSIGYALDDRNNITGKVPVMIRYQTI